MMVRMPAGLSVAITGRCWHLARILSALMLATLFSGAAYAQSLCAVVKIQIQQKVSMERQAFTAVLKISNGLTTIPITDVAVNLEFKDAAGTTVIASTNTDPNQVPMPLFFLRPAPPSGISNGTIAPSTTGELDWLIIPTVGAGGNFSFGASYNVGAKLDYKLEGVAQSVEVNPETILVLPQPQLQLDYFLPHDVYGDDAFTVAVEPPVPFTLGLRVMNVGAGVAQQLSVDSAQPQIVDNQQGLLIDFKLLDSYLNEQPAQPTLLVNLGDLAPQAVSMVRWDMETTLSGRFTDFSATFTHDDTLGGLLTSLIHGIQTHTLVRDVLVNLPGRDALRDFLARDNDVLRVYESNGVDTEVADLSANSSLAGNAMTLPPGSGFVYARVQTTAANGGASAISAVRSDGKALPLANVWTSKERDSNNNWLYYINLFDAGGSAGTYTLSIATDSAPTLILHAALSTPRFAATDQFNVQVGDVAGLVLTDPLNTTTAGSGNQIAAGTGTSGQVLLNPGSTYLLSIEGAGTPAANLGNYQTSISCTNTHSGSSTLLLDGVATSVPLVAAYGDVIDCAFNIAERQPNAGILGVALVESPANASGRFSLSIVDAFGHVVATKPDNANNAQLGPVSLAQGTYSVVQLASPGTNESDYSTSFQCSNLTLGNPIVASGNGSVVSDLMLGAGQQITCTFTDRRQTAAPAFHLAATTNGPDGTFSFTVTGGATPTSPSITTSGGAGRVALGNLTAGQTIDVSETVPSGWTLASTTCSNANPAAPGLVNLPVTLAVGDDIICTYANTHAATPATITVQEATIYGTAAFAFTGSNGLNGGAAFTLDTSGGVLAVSTAYAVAANETVTTLTQTPVAGFPLLGARCRGADNALVPGVTLSGNQLTIPASALTSGAALVCRFDNSPPLIAVAKTVSVPVATGVQNQFQIAYTLVVTNTGTTAGTYDLGDRFAFNGATVDAVTRVALSEDSGGGDGIVSKVFNGEADHTTIVTERSLDPGLSDTFSYTVTYTVNNASIAHDCSNPAGGLRNSAVLNGTQMNSGNGTTCTGSSAIIASTMANAPLRTGPANQYRIRYLTTVTNTGSSVGTYTLTGAFNYPGATVDAVSAIAVEGTDTLTPVPATLTEAGGAIVTGVPIAGNGTTQTYRYDVTFTITDADAVDANTAGCPAGTSGVRNTASLVAADGSTTVSTCSAVPDVKASISVLADYTTMSFKNPIGTMYGLTYRVTVTNSGAASSYEVDDALTFNGAGISNVVHDAESANVTTPVGAFDHSGNTASATLVSDEPIAAGTVDAPAVETFDYDVIFAIEDTGLFDCTAGGGLQSTVTFGDATNTNCFNPQVTHFAAKIDGDPGQFALTLSEPHGSAVATTTIDASHSQLGLVEIGGDGSMYSVTETARDGSAVVGYDTTYECTKPGMDYPISLPPEVVTSGTGQTATLPLFDQQACGIDPGSCEVFHPLTITCVFTNTLHPASTP